MAPVTHVRNESLTPGEVLGALSSLASILLSKRKLVAFIHLGRDARKPVFGGLRTTQGQISLRIRAV